ncbi:MAG: PKD domain-containing protein, partial [Anaerolineae bacterium]|nr:PKD domain-containing protein [Anaerolineae bacterium]
VNPGALVTLDGSGSSDPNGDPLTYLWEQTGGEAVTFAPDLMITNFTAPLSSGPLTFTLTVINTAGLSGTDSVVVNVINLAPTANAGPNLTAPSGSVVMLDGSNSSDPNGPDITCLWEQTNGPSVRFTPNLCVTTFTAPWGNEKLDFALTVTDPGGLSDTDTMKVTVGPVPTADAGAEQQVVEPGETVTLDGSASLDPNGDPLDYYWVQTGGVGISFSPAMSVTTFVAPSGLFTFTLVVTNTAGLSGSDTTTVIASETRIFLPLILNRGPQAQATPSQVVASFFSGSYNANSVSSQYTKLVQHLLSGPSWELCWTADREQLLDVRSPLWQVLTL